VDSGELLSSVRLTVIREVALNGVAIICLEPKDETAAHNGIGYQTRVMEEGEEIRSSAREARGGWNAGQTPFVRAGT